jgi:hypothetical protein
VGHAAYKPEYLEGRQLFFQGRYGHAAQLFGHAIGKGLPTDELMAEALRTEAISRLAIHQYERAAQLFQSFAKTSSAHRAEAEDYLARIRFMQKHSDSTDASRPFKPRPHAARWPPVDPSREMALSPVHHGHHPTSGFIHRSCLRQGVVDFSTKYVWGEWRLSHKAPGLVA